MLQVCMDRVPRSKVRSRVRLPPSKGVGAERKARAESQSGKPERKARAESQSGGSFGAG